MIVGPFAPGTVVSVDPTGYDWANPQYAQALDGNFTIATYPQGSPVLYHSRHLLASNYNGGAIVPVGSTIQIVKFTIHRKANRAAAAYAMDNQVYLHKTSGYTSNNKAYANIATDKWPTVLTSQLYTFTNGVDMTILDTDLNSTDFGLGLYIDMLNGSATDLIASVDYVELTEVNYTPPSSASFRPQVRVSP